MGETASRPPAVLRADQRRTGNVMLHNRQMNPGNVVFLDGHAKPTSADEAFADMELFGNSQSYADRCGKVMLENLTIVYP